MSGKSFIAIDLKSFFASVECVERGLDPLDTNLVVADAGRTEKTICLAVTPSLKAYKIAGRARLFEVIRRVAEVNSERRAAIPGGRFSGKSYSAGKLKSDPSLELDFLTATPRMALYKSKSMQIYRIYLRYVAPEDIHAYSVDEVFIDATQYLHVYKLSAHQFAVKLIREVLKETGITATAGIGTNLYLCKVAMDIVAKHVEPDSDGVRIAELDEKSYREKLWEHTPLTDFWRVGRGIADKLEKHGIRTMGDIALMSINREDLFYRLFGVNAELLIDHAWGWEPCTMAAIKSYRSEAKSISSGQVLPKPYDFEHAGLIVREMTDLLVLELVSKHFVTDQMVLSIGYDVENITDPENLKKFDGEITTDWYGRRVPKSAHGSINLRQKTSSTELILEAVTELYERITDPGLLIRRIYVIANRIKREDETGSSDLIEQTDILELLNGEPIRYGSEESNLQRERRRQHAILDIQKKYGKNAALKAMNFEEGATTIERNGQLGGHKA